MQRRVKLTFLLVFSKWQICVVNKYFWLTNSWWVWSGGGLFVARKPRSKWIVRFGLRRAFFPRTSGGSDPWQKGQNIVFGFVSGNSLSGTRRTCQGRQASQQTRGSSCRRCTEQANPNRGASSGCWSYLCRFGTLKRNQPIRLQAVKHDATSYAIPVREWRRSFLFGCWTRCYWLRCWARTVGARLKKESTMSSHPRETRSGHFCCPFVMTQHRCDFLFWKWLKVKSINDHCSSHFGHSNNNPCRLHEEAWWSIQEPVLKCFFCSESRVCSIFRKLEQKGQTHWPRSTGLLCQKGSSKLIEEFHPMGKCLKW